MHPSSFGVVGNGVIDATVANTFTALIDGGGIVEAYRLSIYNVADDKMYYCTDKIVLDTPFDTCDYNGVMQTFEIEVPADPSYEDEESGEERVVENGGTYKWTLELWEDESAENPTVLSVEQLFRASSSPSLIVTDETAPASIGSKVNTWKAEYTSDVPPSCFQWTLAETDEDRTFYKTIEQTQWIYNSSKIWYKYDGLLPDKYYAVKVSVVNQLSVQTTTDWYVSYIDYDLIDIEGTVQAKQIEAAIQVDWTGLKFIQGTAQYVDDPEEESDDYSVEDGMCHIEEGTFVQFKSEEEDVFRVECDYNSSIAIVIKIDDYSSEEASNLFNFTSNDGSYSRRLDHVGFEPGLKPGSGLTPGNPTVPYDGQLGHFVYTVTKNGISTVYEFEADYPIDDYYSAIVLNSDGIKVKRIWQEP